MQNQICKWYISMGELWQSKNSQYAALKYAAIPFGVMAVAFFGISFIFEDNNNILRYFAALSFIIAMDFTVFRIYVFNNIKCTKFCPKTPFLIFWIVLVVLTMLIGVPSIVIIGILYKMLDKAKKMDNIIDFMYYLGISLIVICLFIDLDIKVSLIMSMLIKNLTSLLGGGLDEISVSFFLFMCLLKFEMDATFSILILIKQKNLKRYKKEKLNDIDNNIKKGTDFSKVDFEEYIDIKDKIIKRDRDRLDKDINFDCTYLKNMLKTFELAVLVYLFGMFIFGIIPQEMSQFQYTSNIMNVLTIFTVIMLFLDKQREW